MPRDITLPMPLVIWQNENGYAYAWDRTPAEDGTGDGGDFDTLAEMFDHLAGAGGQTHVSSVAERVMQRVCDLNPGDYVCEAEDTIHVSVKDLQMILDEETTPGASAYLEQATEQSVEVARLTEERERAVVAVARLRETADKLVVAARAVREPAEMAAKLARTLSRGVKTGDGGRCERCGGGTSSGMDPYCLRRCAGEVAQEIADTLRLALQVRPDHD